MIRTCSLASVAFFVFIPAQAGAVRFPTRFDNTRCQAESHEGDLKKLIEDLASDDIAERERALSTLKTTPLERLPSLEVKLESHDEEFRLRLREAFSGALFHSLGHRVERLSLKCVATRDVMEAWVKDGRDPSKPPKGYEAMENPRGKDGFLDEYNYLKLDQILVERQPVLTNEDLKSADPKEEEFPAGKSWSLKCTLTTEGSRRFDAAAERLYGQDPHGMITIIVGDRAVSMPIVQSPRFGSTLNLPMKQPTRDKASELGTFLNGNWYELSFRLRPENGSSPALSEAAKIIAALPGFQGAKVLESVEPEGRIGGTVNLRDGSLFGLWSALRAKGFKLLAEK